MKMNITQESLANNGISIDEILLLMFYMNNCSLDKAMPELIKKGYITTKYDEDFQPSGYRITNNGRSMLATIMIDGEPENKNSNLTELAKRLKDVFPKGKKDGTNYYWAEGTALIERRLKLFFKKYGTQYTDDQIVNAAEKYVKGFNGMYKYMQLLKYFIFKEKVGAGGDVEGDSQLVNYIENEGQEEDLIDDWTTELR